jgi:hypothetical protein
MASNLVVSDLEQNPGFVASGNASLERGFVNSHSTTEYNTTSCWQMLRKASLFLMRHRARVEQFPPTTFEKSIRDPTQLLQPRWQVESDGSHAMKDDTIRYPRTMVVFAIVMLGTGVERYTLPVLLSLSVASLMLYEDYLDNRLCSSSRLDYGRCCWRKHEAKYQLPVPPKTAISLLIRLLRILSSGL